MEIINDFEWDDGKYILVDAQSLLTTATPKITTNSNDPTPMTITAIAHCGMSAFCSMFSTVGRIRCFGITKIETKKMVICIVREFSFCLYLPIKSVATGSSTNFPIKNDSFTLSGFACDSSDSSSKSSYSSDVDELDNGTMLIGTVVRALWNICLISCVLMSRETSANSTK